MISPKWLSRKLIFVLGKGGVGKSTVSLHAARALASQGKKVLLCRMSSVREEIQEAHEIEPGLTEVFLNPRDCFQEYIQLKLPLKALSSVLLNSRVTDYLRDAAPGIRELVMIGKVWFEKENFDHVVVDMPSSGYAFTMLQTPKTFGDLFPGGPISQDCKAMLATFLNHEETALVVVTLPEEMPAQEACDFAEKIKNYLPSNVPWLVVNRLFRMPSEVETLLSTSWEALTEEEKCSPLWANFEHLRATAHAHTASLAFLKNQTDIFSGAPDVYLDENFHLDESVQKKSAEGIYKSCPI